MNLDRYRWKLQPELWKEVRELYVFFIQLALCSLSVLQPFNLGNVKYKIYVLVNWFFKKNIFPSLLISSISVKSTCWLHGKDTTWWLRKAVLSFNTANWEENCILLSVNLNPVCWTPSFSSKNHRRFFSPTKARWSVFLLTVLFRWSFWSNNWLTLSLTYGNIVII